MIFPFRKSRRALLAEPFPPAWLPYLEGNVFLDRLLSAGEQARLRTALKVVVAEKSWEGCGGLVMTDEVRVTVAAQACLLLLGFEDYFFDEVKSVLVYPGGFLAPDPYGQHDGADHLMGQSHQGGPVILSWWDVLWDGRRPGARNLVLHEFAHKLAERNDPDAGVPPMPDAGLERRWRKVMAAEHRRLVEADRYDRPTLLDPYGAESRAEFFAVATECFFQQPVALREEHPRLYAVLAEWSRQDPAGRRPPDEADVAEAERAERAYDDHVLAECAAAVRLRPDDAEAYRYRADVFYRRGEHDRAVEDLTRVIRLAPDDFEAYCDRGAAHLAAGRPEPALADFSAAIGLRPAYARAHCERGVARAEAGDLDGALADLGEAVRLDPRDDIARNERGLVRHDRGEHAEAVADFTAALRLYPRWAAAHSNRAASLAAMGEHDRALADCDEALRLDPEDAAAHRTRARVYAARGDDERARQEEARADELDARAV
jgi:Mlc titration factor MtfA (ptsG expression regulator)/Flp pilus assembly protein TadD